MTVRIGINPLTWTNDDLPELGGETPLAVCLSEAKQAGFLDAVVDGVFTVPGDGNIDYRAVLSTLKDVGYQGWLVVEAEQDPAVAHPLIHATKGYQYLHQLVDEISP